jgi:hypothetical protein
MVGVGLVVSGIIIGFFIGVNTVCMPRPEFDITAADKLLSIHASSTSPEWLFEIRGDGTCVINPEEIANYYRKRMSGKK